MEGFNVKIKLYSKMNSKLTLVLLLLSIMPALIGWLLEKLCTGWKQKSTVQDWRLLLEAISLSCSSFLRITWRAQTKSLSKSWSVSLHWLSTTTDKLKRSCISWPKTWTSWCRVQSVSPGDDATGGTPEMLSLWIDCPLTSVLI